MDPSRLLHLVIGIDKAGNLYKFATGDNMKHKFTVDYVISCRFFQRQLSIIKFTLNYPPIRNNLTSASLLSMLIETDYLNYPPIRNNLTSASLLSMLIETDYLNYPPIRNNLSSTSLPLSCAGAILKILQFFIKCFRSMTMASPLSMLIETDYNFKKITAVFFGSCLKEFHSGWYCLFIKQTAKLFQHNDLLFEICWGFLFCSIRLSPGCPFYPVVSKSCNRTEFGRTYRTYRIFTVLTY